MSQSEVFFLSPPSWDFIITSVSSLPILFIHSYVNFREIEDSCYSSALIFFFFCCSAAMCSEVGTLYVSPLLLFIINVIIISQDNFLFSIEGSSFLLKF